MQMHSTFETVKVLEFRVLRARTQRQMWFIVGRPQAVDVHLHEAVHS